MSACVNIAALYAWPIDACSGRSQIPQMVPTPSWCALMGVQVMQSQLVKQRLEVEVPHLDPQHRQLARQKQQPRPMQRAHQNQAHPLVAIGPRCND